MSIIYYIRKETELKKVTIHNKYFKSTKVTYYEENGNEQRLRSLIQNLQY